MTYGVYDGVLLISSEEVADPFLVVGHCLVALLAAGLGGVLAPLVCGSRRACLDRQGS